MSLALNNWALHLYAVCSQSLDSGFPGGLYIGLNKSGYEVNIFLISPRKHMLCVLSHYWVPTTCFLGEIRKNINTFWLKKKMKKCLILSYVDSKEWSNCTGAQSNLSLHCVHARRYIYKLCINPDICILRLSWMHVRLVIRRFWVWPLPLGWQHFLWRLIMKYFLWSFSPFCWLRKVSWQFLAKECAQYWLTP